MNLSLTISYCPTFLALEVSSFRSRPMAFMTPIVGSSLMHAISVLMSESLLLASYFMLTDPPSFGGGEPFHQPNK